MTKILIIEDEKVVGLNIRRILQAEGFEAIVAENGVVGVNLAVEQPPNLIICDILMPDVDGYEVLRRLQANSATVGIPFIFLTAKVERADMRQGFELGADDYITKPFDAEELLRAIAARLNKHNRITEQMSVLSEELHKIQTVMAAKERLVQNIDQEFRRPLSNINMALKMLERETAKEKRSQRYLQILQEEFSRELSLLNQMAQLQQLLTPENVALLSHFNLLQDNPQSKS
ncbi:response regulator [Phormidium sp. CCY1219]|uniref:response regulator n=1 Tax=Phormidium sp. CCY1219 TaxID=2886104 RepID=UPI002D1EC155|nr:response regulator [Phormidium sp. CCY1219]MEB3826323.1 response regulator [Phormidium sp. CCY1219]